MNELEQLKQRIDKSSTDGIETSHIKDDYNPAGNIIIRALTDSGEYVQRKTPAHNFSATWKIFKKGHEPY